MTQICFAAGFAADVPLLPSSFAAASFSTAAYGSMTFASRSVTKASQGPSGDHAAYATDFLPRVSCTALPVPTSTRHSCKTNSFSFQLVSLCRKATERASGEIAGARMLVRLKDSASVATCEPWPNPLNGSRLKAQASKADRLPPWLICPPEPELAAQFCAELPAHFS